MSLDTWLLAGFIAIGLPMAQASEPAHPTAHDMAVWKHDVIDQYGKAVYLDERDREISEQEFFRIVQTGKRSFSMQSDKGSKAVITLRLSPPLR